MRKGAAVCLVLLLSASFALGQLPSGNVYVGYSHTSTNLVPGQSTGLNGWNGSVEGKLFPFIGLVADFSGHYGSQSVPVACPLQLLPPCPPQPSNVDVSEYNFLFGPRASFSAGKIRPFAEFLVGAGHVNANHGAGSDTSFVDALGGGLDYRLFHAFGWRFEGDYVQTRFFSTTQNSFRLSTGIVFHF